MLAEGLTDAEIAARATLDPAALVDLRLSAGAGGQGGIVTIDAPAPLALITAAPHDSGW